MSDFGHRTHLRVLRGMIIWSNIYLMSLGAKVIFYEYNLNIETTEYRNSHPLKKKERNSHPDSLYPTKSQQAERDGIDKLGETQWEGETRWAQEAARWARRGESTWGQTKGRCQETQEVCF